VSRALPRPDSSSKYAPCQGQVADQLAVGRQRRQAARHQAIEIRDEALAVVGLSSAVRRSFAGLGRVLVAEDNPINREVVGEFLAEFGCEVDFANDGREAVAALEKTSYALVLMDCQMPGMDGYEATNAFEAEREKTEASGMDDFLSKPLTVGALAEEHPRFRRAAHDRALPRARAARNGSRSARSGAQDGACQSPRGAHRARALLGLKLAVPRAFSPALP
jgi:CheY-like chemotaxis protein